MAIAQNIKYRRYVTRFLCGFVLCSLAILVVPLWGADEPNSVQKHTAEHIRHQMDSGSLKNIDEAGFRQLLAMAEPSAMLDAAILVLEAHPQYTAVLHKVERVSGKLQGEPDIVTIKFQRVPLATYCEWVSGPRKGRKVLYNQAHRPDEILARESGFLGLISLHIGIDNPLTKRDTNHNILELGLEYPIRKAKEDLVKMAKAGKVIDPTDGTWIVEGNRKLWETGVKTAGPPEFYAAQARLRFDIETGLLVFAEIRDKQSQVLESIHYKDVRWVTFAPNTFDEKNPDYGF